MKKKISALFVILLLVVAGVIVGKILIKKRSEILRSYPPPPEHSIVVEYAQARWGKLRETFRYVGKVVPYSRANISTKSAGRIKAVLKREGESFKRGELLVKIDDSELLYTLKALEREKEAKLFKLKALEAQLKAAETTLKNAENEYKRDLTLFEKGAIPKVALEKSENLYVSAQAKVKTLLANIEELKRLIASIEERRKSILVKLNYTRIKAVKEGVVERVFLHPGDMALPGKPIMSVYYPKDGLRVLVNVPQKDVREIETGSVTTVEGNLKARVEKVYPSSDSKLGLPVIEIRLLDSAGIKPNSLVEVSIPGKVYEGIILPADTILRIKEGTIVLKLEEGSIEPVPIKVVKKVDDKVVVRGKLKEGDKVARGRESKLLKLYMKAKGVKEDE